MDKSRGTIMDTCFNCGRKNIQTIQLDDEKLYLCRTCGYGRPLIQEPMRYGEDYEKKYLAYPEKDLCAIRLAFLPPDKDLSILDYGCGSGAFVRAAREKGLTAYGFDVNDFTAELRPPENFYPGILTAWDSFEHLTDEEQKAFFRIAKNAKYICVSLPDFSSAPKDETIEQWRHYRPKEHLHYYSLSALCVRFAREGYKNIRVSHSEDRVRKAPWKNNILTCVFERETL